MGSLKGKYIASLKEVELTCALFSKFISAIVCLLHFHNVGTEEGDMGIRKDDKNVLNIFNWKPDWLQRW